MATISLCMIVRDEEDVIARCLESVREAVDEIIIVDTGSVDETKRIVSAFTDKVFDFEWIDDFAAARNEAFSKASCEYIMWLDADDVFFEEDRAALIALKERLGPDIDMVMMPYHVAFDANGAPTFSYFRERIVRRERGYRWMGAIHEVIQPKGKVVYEQIAVRHKKEKPGDAERNIRIFEKMIERGIVLDPRQQYYYGRELLTHRRLEEAITVLETFLEKGEGWIENSIGACHDLYQAYRIKGKAMEGLAWLFKSFVYDRPRAEICCEIGKYFMGTGAYETAVFWYKLASETPFNPSGLGFVRKDSYDYVPFMQLCVCLDKLGRYQEAEAYNDKALAVKPKDKAAHANLEYFARRKAEIG